MKNLSIIVPIYNKENVLETSLFSLYRFLPAHSEILLIDDFSTDKSVSIASRFSKQEEFRLFRNKVNLGVASTRNLGIKKAEGEYIGFFDADDTVSSHFYEQLLDTAFSMKRRPDVVVGEFLLSGIEEKKSKKENLLSSLLPFELERQKYLGEESRSCCSKIYRKSFLEGKYFPNFFEEDFYFHCWVSSEARRVVENRNGEYMYHLENRKESLSGEEYPVDYFSSFIDGYHWLFQKFGKKRILFKTMNSIHTGILLSKLLSIENWEIPYQEKVNLIGSVIDFCLEKDSSFSLPYLPSFLRPYYKNHYSLVGKQSLDGLEGKIKVLASKYPKR